MNMGDERPLSAVCCERSSDPADQVLRIAALLAEGADIGETDKNGVTPLHHAVRFRSPAAVGALLAHGADVNQTCKRSGSTPLHRAVTFTGAPGTAGKVKERREIIHLLMEAGADTVIQNKSGKSAIDYVSDLDTLQLLAPSADG